MKMSNYIYNILKQNCFSFWISTSLFIHSLIFFGMSLTLKNHNQMLALLDSKVVKINYIVNKIQSSTPLSKSTNNLAWTDHEAKSNENYYDLLNKTVSKLTERDSLISNKEELLDNFESDGITTRKYKNLGYLISAFKMINNAWNNYPFQELKSSPCCVKLKIQVSRNGLISDVELVKSSGSSKLNTAAIMAIKELAYLKPFPESMDKESIFLLQKFYFIL